MRITQSADPNLVRPDLEKIRTVRISKKKKKIAYRAGAGASNRCLEHTDRSGFRGEARTERRPLDLLLN